AWFCMGLLLHASSGRCLWQLWRLGLPRLVATWRRPCARPCEPATLSSGRPLARPSQ
ncbi:unnamed protein product, partial [Polarella glacialis]